MIVTKNVSRKNTFIIVILVLALLLSVAFFGIRYFYELNNAPPVANTDTSIIVADQNQEASGLPVSITIPSINVDARILYVGLASDGSIGVPKGPNEVAWFALGPRPGSKGSAIITGHYGPWRTGAHSVFDNLYKLKQGDLIYVKDDKGVSLSFKVKDSKIYSPDQSPPEVFSKNDGSHLNLITCNGDWIANQKTYSQRLVVFSDAVL